MTFLNPFFIWLIPFVFIPLVIHLLNFRRPEKLAFSSIAFLEELQKTVVRNIKLKEWLLLVTRTLLVAFLLLALAQPYLSDDEIAASNQDVVHLVIENGIGMDRVDVNGPLLNQAKQTAISVIGKAQENQKFTVNTLSSSVISNRALSKSDAVKSVEKIEQSLSNSSWQLFLNVFNLEKNQKIIYISDNHPEKMLHALADTSTKKHSIDWLPVGNPSQLNLHIESISIENQVLVKNKPIQFRATIAVSGEEGAINGTVNLWLGEQIAGEYQIGLSAGQKQDFVFTFTPKESGFIEAKLKLVGDAYLADNERYFVCAIPDYQKVAVVTDRAYSDEELVYLKSLFDAANTNESDLKFEFVEVNAIVNKDRSNYSSIIFLGLKEFPEFLQNMVHLWINDAKGVIVIPSVQSNIQSYNQFFVATGIPVKYAGIRGSFSAPTILTKAEISDEKHPVFNQVFANKPPKSIEYEKPNIFAFYQIEKSASGLQIPILSTELGEPLLVESKVQHSKVIVSGIGGGSAWSNFPSNALFAPLWYRLTGYVSMSESGGIVQTEIGKPFSQKVLAESDDFQMVQKPMKSTEKPLIRRKGSSFFATTQTQGMESGFLSLTEKGKIVQETGLFLSDKLSHFKNAESEEIKNILIKQFKVVNVFDVNTSKNTFVDLTEQGIKLWPIFAVLAFLLLITESTISIWFKAETNG